MKTIFKTITSFLLIGVLFPSFAQNKGTLFIIGGGGPARIYDEKIY